MNEREKERVYTKKEHISDLRNFVDRYALSKSFICDEYEITEVEKASVCRFCGCGFPKVTFNQRCHLVPQILGNRYVLSNFECDACNKKFGRYETNFHNFLGVSRLFNELKDGKTRSFPSGDNAVVFKNNTKASPNPHMLIMRNHEDNPFKLDGDRLEIKYESGNYVPLAIYKSFIKIALSVIDENECSHYKEAFNFLTTKKHDTGLYTRMYKVMQHQFPMGIGYNNVIVDIFEKRNRHDTIPTHHFLLHYKNYVFQTFIPFHKRDLRLKHLDIYFAPPYFINPDNTSLNAHTEILDLSSNQKEKKKTSINARINPKDFENMVAFPLKFDPSKI